MENFLSSKDNITFIIAMVAILFTVYNYFRNPQEALDKREALNQKEADGKASILEQRMQWEKEANVERFAEMSKIINAGTALAQNHIHTVDTKVDALIERVGGMSNEITRLSTIIEERLPKKPNI